MASSPSAKMPTLYDDPDAMFAREIVPTFSQEQLAALEKELARALAGEGERARKAGVPHQSTVLVLKTAFRALNERMPELRGIAAEQRQVHARLIAEAQTSRDREAATAALLATATAHIRELEAQLQFTKDDAYVEAMLPGRAAAATAEVKRLKKLLTSRELAWRNYACELERLCETCGIDLANKDSPDGPRGAGGRGDVPPDELEQRAVKLELVMSPDFEPSDNNLRQQVHELKAKLREYMRREKKLAAANRLRGAISSVMSVANNALSGEDTRAGHGAAVSHDGAGGGGDGRARARSPDRSTSGMASRGESAAYQDERFREEEAASPGAHRRWRGITWPSFQAMGIDDRLACIISMNAKEKEQLAMSMPQADRASLAMLLDCTFEQAMAHPDLDLRASVVSRAATSSRHETKFACLNALGNVTLDERIMMLRHTSPEGIASLLSHAGGGSPELMMLVVNSIGIDRLAHAVCCMTKIDLQSLEQAIGPEMREELLDFVALEPDLRRKYVEAACHSNKDRARLIAENADASETRAMAFLSCLPGEQLKAIIGELPQSRRSWARDAILHGFLESETIRAKDKAQGKREEAENWIRANHLRAAALAKIQTMLHGDHSLAGRSRGMAASKRGQRNDTLDEVVRHILDITSASVGRIVALSAWLKSEEELHAVEEHRARTTSGAVAGVHEAVTEETGIASDVGTSASATSRRGSVSGISPEVSSDFVSKQTHLSDEEDAARLRRIESRISMASSRANVRVARAMRSAEAEIVREVMAVLSERTFGGAGKPDLAHGRTKVMHFFVKAQCSKVQDQALVEDSFEQQVLSATFALRTLKDSDVTKFCPEVKDDMKWRELPPASEADLQVSKPWLGVSDGPATYRLCLRTGDHYPSKELALRVNGAEDLFMALRMASTALGRAHDREKQLWEQLSAATAELKGDGAALNKTLSKSTSLVATESIRDETLPPVDDDGITYAKPPEPWVHFLGKSAGVIVRRWCAGGMPRLTKRNVRARCVNMLRCFHEVHLVPEMERMAHGGIAELEQMVSTGMSGEGRAEEPSADADTVESFAHFACIFELSRNGNVAESRAELELVTANIRHNAGSEDMCELFLRMCGMGAAGREPFSFGTQQFLMSAMEILSYGLCHDCEILLGSDSIKDTKALRGQFPREYSFWDAWKSGGGVFVSPAEMKLVFTLCFSFMEKPWMMTKCRELDAHVSEYHPALEEWQLRLLPTGKLRPGHCSCGFFLLWLGRVHAELEAKRGRAEVLDQMKHSGKGKSGQSKSGELNLEVFKNAVVRIAQNKAMPCGHFVQARHITNAFEAALRASASGGKGGSSAPSTGFATSQACAAAYMEHIGWCSQAGYLGRARTQAGPVYVRDLLAHRRVAERPAAVRDILLTLLGP